MAFRTVLFWLLIAMVGTGIVPSRWGYPLTDDSEIYNQAFSRLESVKQQKKEQLIHYCDLIRSQVKTIVSDSVLLDFFSIENQYYKLQQKSPPTPQVKRVIEEYKNNVLLHYSSNFMQFYDLLFVNQEGDIFTTIRNESDVHKNIFEDDFAPYSFDSTITDRREGNYLDFEYYDPSDEPAAFFVEPIYDKKEFMGWMILQWAVNKLNFLMTDYENLGKTGEVFLVNKDQYLLTDVRFVGDSTILTQHLNTDNIEFKFQQRNGNVIVTDYRGFRVLSAFEVFPFMGSEWLLVVKIDEDEILTEYFERERDRLQNPILEKAAWNGESQPLDFSSKKFKRVDMDEFIKVDNQKILQTGGASTCTVIVASYPHRFAYMAHISPMDRVYGQTSTDILGQIVKRVKDYDIYKYEMRNLEFHVVANHRQSIDSIMERLLQEGFLLSQIHFLYNPQATVADVVFDCESNQCQVKWMKNRERQLLGFQTLSPQSNLGMILKELIP